VYDLNFGEIIERETRRDRRARSFLLFGTSSCFVRWLDKKKEKKRQRRELACVVRSLLLRYHPPTRGKKERDKRETTTTMSLAPSLVRASAMTPSFRAEEQQGRSGESLSSSSSSSSSSSGRWSRRRFLSSPVPRRRGQKQRLGEVKVLASGARSSSSVGGGEDEKTSTATNEIVQRAMRSLMKKSEEEEEEEEEKETLRLDEYARTLVEAASWTTAGNRAEEEEKEEDKEVRKLSSFSLLATSFALDALVLSRLFTLMRKREPHGSETMGIARQIVNISFLGLDTRTLRIRDWPRGTAIFDVQPKECNEYLTPRMKLMNAKVTRGSSLRRVDFDFINAEKKSLDGKKTYVEDALRKEGFREETPTIWICEDLEELVNSEATKMSDFVEEICDLMSRESECCGSVKGVDTRLQNTIKALFAANGAMCSFTEEENGCVLFSAIKMRRSVREEEYYRSALMDALEQIDEDGWED